MTDASEAFDYLTGAMTGGERPDAVGKKFGEDGTVLSDPGCTTLCHVDPAGSAFAAIARAQATLKSGPFAKDFAFLPPASLHMTIFDAFIESGRSRERVPDTLPMDATVEEIISDASQNLTGLSLPQQFTARPTGIFAGFSISMTGANDGEERQLRDTRDRLSDATGIRKADHAAYRFHITLAYNLRWFSADEAQQIIDLSNTAAATLMAEMSDITIGPVEFCSFENMHHFEPLKYL